MPGEATQVQPRVLMVLNAITGVLLVAFVPCFFFGLARFPDGPIHPCDKDANYLYHDHPFGYCGKQGQSHTAADFARYREWDDIVAVLGTALGIAGVVRYAKMRKP